MSENKVAQMSLGRRLLDHASGSKSYEIIVFDNADYGMHVVVQRWGPSHSFSTGGGRILITACPSARQSGALAEKIYKQKLAREYGDRGGNSFGLHDRSPMFSTEKEFFEAIRKHYCREHSTQVIDALGAAGDIFWADESSSIAPEIPAGSAPVVETPRSQHWGSW